MLNYRENLINEMYDRRANMINKLSQVVNPSYAEDFAKMLHYSWQEGLPEAQNIVDKLNFSPIDFSALQLAEDEFEGFFIEEIYMENYG